MKEKRLLYIDVLKVISVFAMILLHVASSNFYAVEVTSIKWQIFNFYDSLVRFCVPVFVMCSGVFFLDNVKDITIRKIFAKYILRIAITFICWSLAYVLFGIYIKCISGDDMMYLSMKRYIEQLLTGHYHMWFLYTIIGLYLIAPILRLITKDKKLTEYFLLLAFIFCFFVNTITIIPQAKEIYSIFGSKLNIVFFNGYTSYFVLGYYLHNNELNKRMRGLIYTLGAFSVIFTIVGNSLISLVENSASTKLYDNLLLNILFASMAIFLFIKQLIEKKVHSERFVSIITIISKFSFAIYLVHDFFLIIFKELGLSTLEYNAIIFIPIKALIVFWLSFLVACGLNRIPILNKWIM